MKPSLKAFVAKENSSGHWTKNSTVVKYYKMTKYNNNKKLENMLLTCNFIWTLNDVSWKSVSNKTVQLLYVHVT